MSCTVPYGTGSPMDVQYRTCVLLCTVILILRTCLEYLPVGNSIVRLPPTPFFSSKVLRHGDGFKILLTIPKHIAC